MGRRLYRITKFAPSGYSYGNPRDTDYGCFLSPLYAAYKAKKGLEDATASGTALGVVKDYWWAFLLAVPFVYVGLNVGLDYLGAKKVQKQGPKETV